MPLQVKQSSNIKNNESKDFSALIKVDLLPSKFLPYPEKSEIFFRSYTYGEISQISQSKVGINDKINMAIRGITTKGFNVDEISYFDLQYVSLLRRGSTFATNDFSVRYKCRNKEVRKIIEGKEKIESCQKENFEILPLTNFEFIDLEIPQLPINVKFKDRKVRFDVFRVKDYLYLNNVNKADDAIAILAIQTDIKDFEEAYKFIQGVSGDDLVLLKRIDVMLNHGLKHFKLKCRDCGYINYIGPGEGDVIIMPFCSTKDTHGDVISFG